MNEILRQNTEAIVHAANGSVIPDNAVATDTKWCFRLTGWTAGPARQDTFWPVSYKPRLPSVRVKSWLSSLGCRTSSSSALGRTAPTAQPTTPSAMWAAIPLFVIQFICSFIFWSISCAFPAIAQTQIFSSNFLINASLANEP